MTIEIIADLGANWDSEQDIIDAIAPVKAAGADVFKVQYFNYQDLYGIRPDTQLRPKIDIGRISLECEIAGIEFMCSVFNPNDVVIVDRYVKRHKIASAEATHPVLLEAVAATHKPVIISTGCLDQADFKDIFGVLDHNKTTVLYCVSEYPAKDVDLGFLGELDNIRVANSWSFGIGFSDHCLDICQTSCTAVIVGTEVLEKHVHHKDINGNRADMGHSISTNELKEYCDKCRAADKLEPSSCLFINNQDFVRRPIAINHIDSWQKLEYGNNWGFYRGRGVDAIPIDNFAFMAQYRANSMISRHAIKAGDPIFLHSVRLVPKG